MRITICAVGRMRGGPEKVLVDDYLRRLERTGRSVGVGPCKLFEVEDRKGGKPAAEAELLGRSIPQDAYRILLDERGRAMGSAEFAGQIAGLRDQGRRDAAFVIGGADGFDPEFRSEADLLLSLGPMVWPHMLARVMLAEQLYRATTILAGTPYHRA